MEKWYSIEPTKGYVCKSDFESIKRILKAYFGEDIVLIKKQSFIILIIKRVFVSINEIYKLLNGVGFKKVYGISRIRDINGIMEAINTKYIGMPY